MFANVQRLYRAVDGENNHIQALRLFEYSRPQVRQTGFRLTEEERRHLWSCEVCAQIVAVFARQWNEKKSSDGEKPESAA